MEILQKSALPLAQIRLQPPSCQLAAQDPAPHCVKMLELFATGDIVPQKDTLAVDHTALIAIKLQTAVVDICITQLGWQGRIDHDRPGATANGDIDIAVQKVVRTFDACNRDP